MPLSALRGRPRAPRPAGAVPRPASERAGPDALVYAAIAVAALIRAAHVLAADFPLNDGGLFYAMTRDIQEAGYRLPMATSYNAADIPFAYSPLAFYIAAAINDLTGIPLLQLFRFLPLLATTLLVAAFYRLARAMVPDRAVVLAAVAAFAVTPRSFAWLLMGGGLTRSFGLLFAVLALEQSYRLYTERRWRYAAGAAVACALTVLTHVSTAAFLAASIALFFVAYGRHLHGIVSSAAVAAGTVLLSAPWWATVLGRHGTAPFIAAGDVSGSVFSDIDNRYATLTRLARFNLETTGEPLFPVVAFLAVLGAFTALRPGRVVLVAWWAMIILLDTRAGPNYAAVPAAMLAGYGVVDVLLPALRAAYGRVARGPGGRTAEPAAPGYLRHVPAAVVGLLFAFGVASALSRSPDYGAGEGPGLRALTAGDRAAMRWVRDSTPPESRFVVLTGQAWHWDKAAEWFPALAARHSVSTVQGLEWRPGFTARVDDAMRLQRECGTGDGACVREWAAGAGLPYTHVYVVKDANPVRCCTPLVEALRRDPAVAVLYDGPGALVARAR